MDIDVWDEDDLGIIDDAPTMTDEDVERIYAQWSALNKSVSSKQENV